METQNESDLHESGIIYDLPPEAARYMDGTNGEFVFFIYGCVVLETRNNAGLYIYSGINIKTGKSEKLRSRKTPLDKRGCKKLAKKIFKSMIRGDGIYTADKKPGESAKSNILTETLYFVFTNILPQYGYAVRDKQIELAEHILAVTGRRGVTLAESEVGTGKTHAYLIAAVLAKRGRINEHSLRGHYPRQGWAESAYMPVVISTSSIALQNAIDKDYIPEISRILMQHDIIREPLVSAVRKGKEHYVCERRLNSFTLGTDAKTRELLKPFTGADAPFDLTDADGLTPHMKRRICVSGRCSDFCPQGKQCRYRRYINFTNSPKVDFLITNHNYLIADRLHRAGGKRPLLPHYQLVIIDEAHKFLAAARSMYGLELTDSELPELAREIHTLTLGKSNKGVNIHRFAKRLEEQSGKLFRRLNDNIPESEEDDDTDRFHAVMDGDALHYLKNIAGISDDLAEAVADSHVQTLYRDRQSKAIWRLNMIEDRVSELRKQSKLIHWLEKSVEGEKETDALCAIPKDLNERLYRDLWNGGIPIVLTSGTLSASGDFTRAKETLGLDRLPSHRLSDTTMPSPFDHKNNALLYISENTPFPDNKDKRYITAVADEIERLVLAAHGHAAVLFTSYNAMGQVHTILNGRNLPFPLFRLERGGVHAIERFKRSGNGVLLASGALWEGIDIPGDTLSLLIIVKLPFAVPDPIGDYEKSLCGSMEVYKARCVVPDMLVKLKQGFGRLIRSETDTGVVAILDSRANGRGAYRSRVLMALPPCRVTSSVAAVKNFMLEKKAASYFNGKSNYTKEAVK